jgi:hypothetical protein
MLLWLMACDDSEAGNEQANTTADAGSDATSDMVDAAGPKPVPKADLDEMVQLGIREFLGAAKPVKMETVSGVSGVVDGSIVYDFNPEDGPVCMRGAPFQMSVLDQGSKNLVIFMQGGGACVSVLCSATTEATPRGVPQLGMLDPSDPDNPVADWNIVYVPYCDGSVFGGNNDFGQPTDSTGMRLHHGQRNFAAALDRAIEHFPHPEKILLAGSSAGGWGTVYHRALVRTQYPDAELTVMNDSGLGFSVNTELVAGEWGSGPRYRPASCADCQVPHQHMGPFVKYDLEHDPGIVVGDFSSWEDSVIQRFTLTSDPAAFRKLLADETNISAQAFPERYKRFFINGSQHTSLQRGFHTTQLNGVTIAQWLGMMIARDPAWAEMLE